MKTIRTAGCFLEYDGKFVILHRQPHKPEGNTWGLPAGKVDPGETDQDAVLRELWEETGYRAKPDELEFLGEEIFHFPELTVEFPTFRVRLTKPFDVTQREGEHQDHKWVTADECYAMPDLIHGLHDLLVRIGYVKGKKA